MCEKRKPVCKNCGHEKSKHVRYGFLNRKVYCIADNTAYPSWACGCQKFELKKAAEEKE